MTMNLEGGPNWGGDPLGGVYVNFHSVIPGQSYLDF